MFENVREMLFFQIYFCGLLIGNINFGSSLCLYRKSNTVVAIYVQQTRQGKIADPDEQDQPDPNYKFLIKTLHVHCDNLHGLNVQ